MQNQGQGGRNGPGDDSPESDDEPGNQGRGWPRLTPPPIHYAYDAVAERTQRLLREQAKLANGVH